MLGGTDEDKVITFALLEVEERDKSGLGNQF